MRWNRGGPAWLASLQWKEMFSALVTHWRFVWLVTASMLAGAINAMAGGGSFLSFPAMLGVGVPPIEANATNTVALWPGQLTSLATLRGDVQRTLLPVVVAASVAGGVAGAEVLLHTRQRTFLHLIPWLLLSGALIFGVSGPVSRWLRTRSAKGSLEHHEEQPIHLWVLFAMLFPVCFYIGFFGGGGGGPGDDCAGATRHGEDAPAQRDESGSSYLFQPVRHLYLHPARAHPVALLPGLHAVRGRRRIRRGTLRTKDERRHPACRSSLDRRRDRRLFLLETGLSVVMANLLLTQSALRSPQRPILQRLVEQQGKRSSYES